MGNGHNIYALDELSFFVTKNKCRDKAFRSYKRLEHWDTTPRGDWT